MLLIIVCVLILAVNVLIGAGIVVIYCENNTIIFSNVFLAHAS